MSSFPEIRTGIGTDIHAFAAPESGRPMWLACLEWPGEVGLEGHSDADVVAHACCDALLAAAGLGDLGTHFGTSRSEWEGASGEVLLRETLRIISEGDWRVLSVSVQVLGNRPRVARRRAEAQARLTDIVGAPVNFGASTTDSLGFAGRGEGLMGIASALIARY